MPVALRLATLDNRQFQLDELELTQLSAHIEELDALCKALGVTPLSRFIDVTALELREASQLLPAADHTINTEPDPETGLPYGLEDMTWFPIAAGMTSLEALTGHLQHNPLQALDSNEMNILRNHLACCEQRLQPLEAEGALFHLAAD